MAVRKPPSVSEDSRDIAGAPSDTSRLEITNAHENNLKGVSLDIPHDEVSVITGVSGSGKSSLAFDTVYAEGQRRYIETFSPYTRQFFDKVKKPDVDSIRNVRPAIAIQQRTRITSSRSTVGSMTNINDYLKVLWSNLALPSCPECHTPLQAWTPQSLAEHLQEHKGFADDVFLIVAPVTVDKKYFELEMDRLKTLGFSRFFHTTRQEVLSIEEVAIKKGSAEILVVLDRVRIQSITVKRVRNTIEQAFQLSGGVATILSSKNSSWESKTFRNYYYCESHNIKVQKPKSYLFSFNHPLGACEACRGFGHVLEISRERCVPDHSKTLKDHALQCWSGDAARHEYRRLMKFCAENGIDTDTPWSRLSSETKERIFTHKSRTFIGVLPWFKHIERKAYKMHVRVFLSRYREQVLCPECQGTRLRKEALSFLVGGMPISQIWSMSLADLSQWLTETEKSVRERKETHHKLKDIFTNLHSRIQYMIDLGLPYLTLDRQARTLSGGETQRVNLATALGSELVSTHFVLDEPSVGLHARDSERLISAVSKLSRKGNSLLVVEHDPDFIDGADTIIEIGPESGKNGGHITFNGPRTQWNGFDVTVQRSPLEPEHSNKELHISGAHARNLKDLSISIPLEQLVCLTGVSGSGKSTLVHEVIEHAYKNLKNKDVERGYRNVSGFELIDSVIIVDQSPLAKSPRANIATYSKIWDTVREYLASTDQAKTRSLSKSSFSFNVNAGRCPACEGAGFIREDMQFLSDVYVPCETCLGRRFQETVLEVEYKGKNVHDFLQMTVDEAREFFSDVTSIEKTAHTLSLLGLGHLTLGHPLSELSGGEAQRLKLVPYVQQSSKSKSLLIFDEPTTGLHIKDIEKLIHLFHSLVKEGHSILCVEHNLSVIASADWIIDLGPEGGEFGGTLIGTGTPEDIIKNRHSLTGKYLKEYIGKARRGVYKDSRRLPVTPKKSPPTSLVIQGAREHNLKNVSLSIPLNKMVAVTGVSGSGKSTIAKDIIYAEGQRRYLDCLSPYARQFIKELKKPEIDSIENVRPTICVYQHTFQPSQLSTVGTMSEIYNFLRLLYAKTGIQHCPEHPEQAITPLSHEEIAKAIQGMKSSQIRILAPVIKLKKGTHKAVFTRALETEVSEVRVDGMIGKPGQFSDGLEKTKPHSIDFVIAKCNPRNMPIDILIDTVKLGLSVGGGTLIVLSDTGERIFSSERTCAVCSQGFFKPDPEDLSFNSKRGVCPECDGYGVTSKGICSECSGSRLNKTGRNIRILGKNIHEATLLTPPDLLQFLLDYETSSAQKEIISSIFKELRGKIDALIELGLEYVTLNRDCATLSGGELQRLRLATAMGSPLSGVMYIFDEPSAGLHPLDNEKVLGRLRKLSDAGNSVLVIEHDVQSIAACDSVLDVGPGAGTHGGEIVFNGSFKEFKATSDSLTAQALSLVPTIPERKTISSPGYIHISKATLHNLKNISTQLPLHNLIAVCGVSGAGKSSLIHGTIAQALIENKKQLQKITTEHGTIELDAAIDKVIYIDQKPIGANSRSTPASYLGIWDDIRKLFAQTLEAKANGWDASYFSYNTGKGRCGHCKGYGLIKLEMNFLADAQVLCEQCDGSRYIDEIQLVKYLGRSIDEVLKLTFEDARQLFTNHKKIHHVLRAACELGLGYLTLGQSSTTLSGGESQRLRLVSELSGTQRGHTLYVLDEPTIGLHRADVAKLIASLRALVAHENTVIVIEHDIDTIIEADYVLELGPGPGDAGGMIISEGTPHEIMKGKSSWGSILSSLVRTKDFSSLH